ncbi:MAG: BON domain-containing protein [Terracidiphilus sp.]
MINRPWIKRAFPTLALSAGLLAVSGGAVAFAQDSGSNAAGQNAGQNPGQNAAPGQRTDGQVEMDVVKALDASAALKNDLITAATIQGEVTLSGTVSDQSAKDLAASIVSRVAGVTNVHNNLEIGNPEQAAENDQLPIGDETAPPPADQNQGQSQDQGQNPGQNPDQGAMPPPQPQAPEQPPAPPMTAPAPYPGTNQGQNQAPYPPYPPQNRPQYPGQYPPQYPNQYPSQNPNEYPPQYQQPQYPPQQPNYQQATGPVTIPQGTLLQVRTNEPVDSKRAVAGTPVQFTVIQDVTYGGVVAIPRGATVHGVVSDVKKVGQGQLGGSSELALQLTWLDLGGRTYPLQSNLFKVKGPSKTGETVHNAVGGALLGAIIGGIAGRGAGAAIGAGAGAAAGTAASAATPGPRAWIPAEALVSFHLVAPVTVTPVSPQEAARLAKGLYPGGPNLYRRGYYPYGPNPYGARYMGGPYGPGPYGPYGYPPVYYRPYYMAGGYYYWR